MLVIFSYISIFFISLTTNLILIPIVIKFCMKYKVIDQRNKNNKEIRVGGLTILTGVSLSIFTVFTLSNLFNFQIEQKSELLLIFFSVIPFFLIGFLDDIFILSPYYRLFFQILISIIIWSQGICIKIPDLLISYLSLSESLITLMSLLITIIWIVGITNAINWIDGLDGLATGFVIITCLGFIILGFYFNRHDVVLFTLALCGASLGFLKYNFHPSSILMGDGGSYLMGSGLSILSIIIFSSKGSLDNFFMSILLLFIPIIDMTQVVLTRIIAGFSPFYPDKRHIHHRLMNNGFGHKETVLVLYGSAMFVLLITLITHYLSISPIIFLSLLTMIGFYIKLRRNLI